MDFLLELNAALLGYLAGGMSVSDVALTQWIQGNLLHHIIPVPGIGVNLNVPAVAGAVCVVAIGHWLAGRQRRTTK